MANPADHTTCLGVAIVVVSVIGAAMSIAAAIEADRRTKDYLVEHHCFVVSTREGHAVTGSGWVTGGTSGGQTVHTTTYIPGDTCYHCDPGPRGVSVCVER